MSANPNPPMGAPRARSRTGVLWLLFFGLMVALGGNVYQFVRIEHLSRDMTLTQRSNDRQYRELRDGISGVLEQSLLRYEELNRQMQGNNETALREAASEAKKRNAELTKSVENRHGEELKQLADLRSGVRQDTAAKLSEISQNVETQGSEVKRVAGNLETVKSEVERNSPQAAPTPIVATVQPASPPQTAPAPKKRRFWSRLNPFRGKNKQPVETAGNGAGDLSKAAPGSSQ